MILITTKFLVFILSCILFIYPIKAETSSFKDDINKLSIFKNAFDKMYGEMKHLNNSATRHETGYFSNIENDQIENLLFQYLILRTSVWEIINKYRDYSTYSDDPSENMKALIIGYTSALTLYKYSGILITTNMGDGQAIDKLNESYYKSGIPRGSFQTVYMSLTKLEHLDELDIAHELISTEMNEPGTELYSLIKDPIYGPLLNDLDQLHFAHVKLREEILNHFVLITPELTNRLRHSSIKKKVEDLIKKAGGRFNALKAMVLTYGGHLKSPISNHLTFSDREKDTLISILQPGDIILTYSEGYMSNIFLPGIFTHGIVFIGSKNGWEENDWLTMDISHEQRSLIKQGDDIIEAISEGVVSNSLKKILEKEINRLAVFRPDLSKNQIQDVLKTVHSYLGNLYDFSFDFNNAETQVCTELIYRGFNDIGPIHFELSKRAGVMNMSAEDICRSALETGNLELVTLVIEDEYRAGRPRFVDKKYRIKIMNELLD